MQLEIEEIARRLAVVERIQSGSAVTHRPTRYERPPEEASVTGLSMHSMTATQSGSAMILTWVDSEDRRVNQYEIWAKEDGQTEPHLVTKVERSPATFIYPVASDTPTQFLVRPLYRDGGGAALERAVSTAENVPAIVNPAVQITSPSQIDPGVVNDTHFDRVSANAIQIGTADIANLAVTNAKINDLAATKITAGTFVAGVVYAGSIAATQITAGTLAAGVILASNIAASQVAAGTMTAVNVSAGTYSLTSGSNVMEINGTLGFAQTFTSTGESVRILTGGISVQDSGGFTRVSLNISSSQGSVAVHNSSGTVRARMTLDGSGNGQILINGQQVLTVRQTDPGASPTTDQIRTILLAHGLI